MAEDLSPRLELAAMPRSRPAVARMIRRVGQIERRREALRSRLNNKVALVQKRFLAEVEPLDIEEQGLVEALMAFDRAHHEVAAFRGKRTLNFPTGDIGRRLTPPALKIEDEDVALADLVGKGLEQFYRVYHEINREALLNAPEVVRTIPGAAIERQEKFFVKPKELDVSASDRKSRLERVLGKLSVSPAPGA